MNKGNRICCLMVLFIGAMYLTPSILQALNDHGTMSPSTQKVGAQNQKVEVDLVWRIDDTQRSKRNVPALVFMVYLCEDAITDDLKCAKPITKLEVGCTHFREMVQVSTNKGTLYARTTARYTGSSLESAASNQTMIPFDSRIQAN